MPASIDETTASSSRCYAFLSYRRGDSGGFARMLFEHLGSHFGRDRVFFDVETLKDRLGQLWQAEIQRAIRRAKVVLVVIGPDWFLPGADGKPRINEPDDVLQGEITLALQTGCRVIPVLVGDAKMPDAGALPLALAPLAQRQGMEVRPSALEEGVSALKAFIERIPGTSPGLGPDYLETIQDRFRAWGTRFTELQLTFNLQLSTWEGQRYGRRGPDSRVPLTAANAVLKHPNLILIGEPGSGKTTILQRLALDAAMAALETGTGPIPLFIRLQLWDARAGEPARRSVLRMMLASLEAMDVAISETELTTALRAPTNRFLILFDGLNEVAYQQRPGCASAILEFINALPPDTGVVITSRKYNYRDMFGPPYQTMEVLELSPEGIHDYLEKAVGTEAANAVYAGLSLRVRRLIQNPLLLSFASAIYKENRTIPRSRAVLIREFIHLDLNREIREQRSSLGDPEIVHAALAQLGLHMESAGLAVPREDASRVMSRVPSPQAPEDLIKELLSARILEPAGERVRFWHQAVQEYFAACAMAKQYLANGPSAIREYTSEPKWHEAFAMMTGLLPDDAAPKLIEAVERRSFLLAAMCAANANSLPAEEDARFVSALERRLTRVSLFPDNILNCAALLLLLALATVFYGTRGRALSFMTWFGPLFEAPVLGTAWAAHQLHIPFPAMAESIVALAFVIAYCYALMPITSGVVPLLEDRLYRRLLNAVVMPTLSALRYISINSDSARSTLASVAAMAEQNPFLPAAVRDYVRVVAGGVEREDELRQMLYDPANRMHAIHTLGEVGSTAVVGELKDLVRAEHGSLAVDAALTALGNIAKRNAARDDQAVEEVTEALREVYDDPARQISSRRIAREGLISLGGDPLPEPRLTFQDVIRAFGSLGSTIRDFLEGAARPSPDRYIGAGAKFGRIRSIQEALILLTPHRGDAWVLVAFVLLTASVRGVLLNATQLGNAGMAPEIRQGDVVAFARTAYFAAVPERGDVVLYTQRGLGEGRVGRVIGLPRERVGIDSGRVFVNGRRLIEPYVIESSSAKMEELTLPGDEYLILADNRVKSIGDSRRLGPVPRAFIAAKASMCYWPLNRIHIIRSAPLRFE